MFLTATYNTAGIHSGVISRKGELCPLKQPLYLKIAQRSSNSQQRDNENVAIQFIYVLQDSVP